MDAILSLENKLDEYLTDLSMQTKQSSTIIASLAKVVQFKTVKQRKQKV